MTSPAPAPHYKKHRQRQKQRYVEAGIEAFHEYEALELLLFYGIPQGDVKPLAKELLGAFGSFRAILDADIADLEARKGVGPHTAILLKLVKDLASLYLRQKAVEKPQITCTAELLDYCRTSMGGLKDERFSVVYLDARNRIIDVETIQEGIVNQAVVYPRKVLENALKRKASALILVHNHPSGYVQPSDADVRLTRTLQETARALDILIHDHLIVGENRIFSFREEGMMA
jgi:DNA repair protein RadC